MEDKKDKAEPSFEELLKESFKPAPSIKFGEKIDTRIVAMDNEFIYLDLGTRVEGFVKKSEYMEKGKLVVKEGQAVTVYVTGKKGEAYQCARWFASAGSISPDVQGDSVPFALRDAYAHGVPVEGKVGESIKGGFEVTVMGKKAFCPLSQIEKGYCENPEVHQQKTYTFKVTQLDEDEKGQNIVLSRKEILLAEDQKKAEKLWQDIKEGHICNGIVSHVQNYGAFVDIGGIQGLLHVSEISYSRIEDARHVLQPGQSIEVEVISVDRDKRKIGLSLKTRLEDPWAAALRKIAVGDEVQGKVIKMKSFGAFVEIFPGVVGLVHLSQLGSDRQYQHPKEVLKLGATINVQVLKIDEVNKTISLSLEIPDPDVSEDRKKLEKDQEETLKSRSGQMENLLDAVVKKEDK